MSAITPLQALRRLVDIARLIDDDECPELYNQLQGELAVAGAVLAEPQQEPVAYLRFRAAQQWSGVGGHDIEHAEWLETCQQHEIGDDKMPAFPVWTYPVTPESVAAQPYAGSAAPAGEMERDIFLHGVIAALGALAPHHRHGDVVHDEIVRSVGKEALYRAAEPEDIAWAALDPEYYAAITATKEPK